ncbi:hypothetical protein SNE40_011230 [Patella caerulea]|uniref:Uncharacterized protein n=1 Tax=Patella caerulea TaxID=87958 RepID=A0AAN8PLA2_PATCE
MKSYFEGKPDLKLDEILNVIKAFYKEENSTELYNQLTNLTQQRNETALSFVMKALDLRQRLIFASRQHSGLSYDTDLVDSVLKRTLYTGIINENIRGEVKILLDKGSTDEQLLSGVNMAMSRETERAAKFTKTRVASVQEPYEGKEKAKDRKDPREGMF